MYRNVILEFLSTNDKVIHENECYQMTIVLFPFQPIGLNKLFMKEDDITIYHIKDHYTFEKKYPIENLSGTIIELLIEDKKRKSFFYEEFGFEIKDPYYLKDIREQNFQSLEINPIFEDNDLIAGVIGYSHKSSIDLNISNRKWYNLILKLIDDQNKFYNDNLFSKILNNEELYYVVKNTNTSNFFLNMLFQHDYQFSKDIIGLKDIEYPKLKKYIAMMKKIIDNQMEIYYLSKKLFLPSENDLKIYLFDLINHHNFVENYTFIFAKDIDEQQTVIEIAKKYIEAIKKVMPNNIFKIYQIDNSSIAILLNRETGKKEEADLRFILKKAYFLVINLPKNLSIATDLKKLSTYLNEILPTEFSIKDYKEYQNNQNMQKLKCDTIHESKGRIIIKADTMQTIGQIINGIIPDYYSIANYKIFENSLINTLDLSLKKDLDKPIFTVLTKSLIRRKIYEQLKKIILKYPETKIILHAPKIFNQPVEEIYNLMAKIKELGYIIIVDSTIFMSLEYNICLKLADAILIRKQEMHNSIIDSNPFNQKLFKMYYEYGKVNIFEEIPKECDIELINELTCLIIDNE